MCEFKLYTTQEMARTLQTKQLPLLREGNFLAGISAANYLRETSDWETVIPDLEPAKRIYFGPMYCQEFQLHSQRSQPTCFPMGIINGVTATGIEIDPEVATDLVNIVLDNENQQRRWEGVMNTYLHDYSEYCEIETSFKLWPITRINNDTWEETVKYWAYDISMFLEQGQTMITPVKSAIYDGRSCEDGGRHAICIVGYEMDPQLGMLVQVLDSARQNIWMRLEHLCKSIDPKLNTLVVYPSTEYITHNWYQRPDPLTHQLIGAC